MCVCVLPEGRVFTFAFSQIFFVCVFPSFHMCIFNFVLCFFSRDRPPAPAVGCYEKGSGPTGARASAHHRNCRSILADFRFPTSRLAPRPWTFNKFSPLMRATRFSLSLTPRHCEKSNTRWKACYARRLKYRHQWLSRPCCSHGPIGWICIFSAPTASSIANAWTRHRWPWPSSNARRSLSSRDAASMVCLWPWPWCKIPSRAGQVQS